MLSNNATIIEIGPYKIEFPNTLCQRYKKLMHSDLQSAALSFVECETGISDMNTVCKNHSLHEIRDIIVNGIADEFSLFGEAVHV